MIKLLIDFCQMRVDDLETYMLCEFTYYMDVQENSKRETLTAL